MSERYIATTRQLTGTPYVHHAYVYDRRACRNVMACTHRHGERRSRDPKTGRYEQRGAEQARACAERMLRRVLKRAARAAEVAENEALASDLVQRALKR